MATAIILAAGKSTRTYPLTVTRPKALLKVVNRTIIDHILDQLEGLVDEAVIIVGYKKEMIQEHLGNKHGSIKLTFIEQDEQLGTGHALLAAKGKVKGRFLMLAGDDLYSAEDLKRMFSHKYAALASKQEDPRRFGVYVLKKDKPVGIVEKPDEPPSNLANTSCYMLDDTVFGMLEKLKKSKRGEYEVTDAINILASEGKLELELVLDYWHPISYPWNLLEANSHFLTKARRKIEGEVGHNVTINGEVSIGKGTLVRDGTYIDGPVVIGKNCIIGPGAYIRPETSIGDNCNIRAEVFDTIIGDGCAAKHNCYIGHSVLGEDVNIGAGTVTSDYRHDGRNHITVVNDAKVDTNRRKLGSFMGDHVRTAINTSIYPGRKIWPWTGTLPGEVVTKDKMGMELRQKS